MAWTPRHSYFWVDLDNSAFTEQEMTYSAFAVTVGNKRSNLGELWNWSEERKEKIWQKLWKGKVTLELDTASEWSTALKRESRSHGRLPLIGSGPACPECGSGTIPTASHTEYKKKTSQTYSCINEKCKHRWVERD